MTVVTIDGRFEYLFYDTDINTISEFVRGQLNEGKKIKVHSVELREVGREDITEYYAQGY